MWNWIKDLFDPAVLGGARRSSNWRYARQLHLDVYDFCVSCGGRTKLRVHHILPFHTHPELELDPGNLITLCQRKKYGVNCHLLSGHNGNFRRINDTVAKDAIYLAGKLLRLPE
jgi:5-methylcytosine-specific restriction protein A